jgi:hypothetical protein
MCPRNAEEQFSFNKTNVTRNTFNAAKVLSMSFQDRQKWPKEASTLCLLIKTVDFNKLAPIGPKNGAMFANGERTKDVYRQTSSKECRRTIQFAEEDLREKQSLCSLF